MQILYKIEKKALLYNTHKDIAIEKKELGMDNNFVDFPDILRLEIKEGAITTYMTFNLSEKDGIIALYKCTSIHGEKLLILPKLPKRS